MSFKGKASSKSSQEGGAFEVIPADTLHAVLVGIIDLGTHAKTYKDQKTGKATRRNVRSVALVWEITEEAQQKKDGSNHFFAKEYNLSFDVKSGLRLALQSVRGKAYQEGEEVDPTAALGKPWALTFIHSEKDKGGEKRVYANLDGVGKVKGGAKVPAPTIKPFTWEIGDGDPPDFPWMPRVYGQQIKDLIEASSEWQKLRYKAPKTRDHDPDNAEDDEQLATAGMAKDEDDIPF